MTFIRNSVPQRFSANCNFVVYHYYTGNRKQSRFGNSSAMAKSKKISISSPVLPHVFKALERADMVALSQCKEEEIRPILPCLVRMSLIAPIEYTVESTAARNSILKILSGIETVNAMVALLSVDFPTLESDFKKEQQLRQKVGGLTGGAQEGSILVQNLINGLSLEFECSEPLKRLRLLLSEIIYVMAQLKEPRLPTEWYHKDCELFDNQCYFEEVADILSIGVSELPGLLSPGELAETLLHFSNAPHLIARIVANQPDYFKEVLCSLISNGEAQDEECAGGKARLTILRTLCLMNPSMALHARYLCVEKCHMPGLAIYLTLDAAKSPLSMPNNPHIPSPPSVAMGGSSASPSTEGGTTEIGDVVSFITGLLLSPDQQQRAWFSLYVKNAQKRKWDYPSGLSALRSELSERLCALLLFRTTHLLPTSQVVPATALLRLYTALKNLPGMKLHEEKEVVPLLQLLTCQPPVSAAGVRFVSTGLCVLIACPQLLATPENERRAADWIKWLVQEEVHFSGALGDWSSSFGALLLLVAIHFHAGQMNAILDLVSSALGMRVLTKTPQLARIRHIVTQEVFTESVVTLIASKVSVTCPLSASLPGFLPVHCVYHLLKSRMFTRHRVNIKNWIYRQVCCSRAPMHPILPQLVEVYVRSVLGGGHGDSATNDPITEREILAVFQLSAFSTENSRSRGASSSSSTARPRLRNTTTHCVMFRARGGTAAGVSGEVQEKGVKKEDHGSLEVTCVLTSQLLLLYYLLLYEDLRLSAAASLSQGHPLHAPPKIQHYTYSASLFSQLPIRYLLSRAQRDQAMYGGLFSALLRLLAHHYPQLCLVEDWLYRAPRAPPALLTPRTPLTPHAIAKALSQVSTSPGVSLVLLERCMRLPSAQLWAVAAAPLTAGLGHLLHDGVPRTVLDKYLLVWRRLNAIYPRRLWSMTVEGLRAPPHYSGSRAGPVFNQPGRRPLTEDDLVLDPLYVLRCHPTVYRRAPLLQLVEYMLRVYLLSSRTFLQQQQPPPQQREDRDKLRGALVLTQESAAVQILLETVLSSAGEGITSGGALTLQEVQSVVFSYLHQAFIRDTTLAKLVHFQGYPLELVGPVVAGVPSMHIAVGLGWIPELLQLPHTQLLKPHHSGSLQQLLFTLELTARLALQNALPSTLSIARLAVNVLSTLISVLSSEGRLSLVRGALPALVSLGRVFPVLLPDVTTLLATSARLSRAHASILPAPALGVTGVVEGEPFQVRSDGQTTMDVSLDGVKSDKCGGAVKSSVSSDAGDSIMDVCYPKEDALVVEVTKAFRRLVVEAVMPLKIY